MFLDEKDDPRSHGLSDFEKFIERDERAVVKILKKLNVEESYDEVKKMFPTLEVKRDGGHTPESGFDGESLINEQRSTEMVPLAISKNSEGKKSHV